MFRNFNPEKPHFYSIALSLILGGAAIFSIGIVEWLFNYYGSYQFYLPLLKVIGGLVVLGLGYIHLECELLRLQLVKNNRSGHSY